MQQSDFLTILGLALAIWSIIPGKERKFILLFFSNAQVSLFSLSWLIVLYLMAFDWMKDNWFPWLSIFTTSRGIPASSIAFIVSLIVITLPIIKVTVGFFSREKTKDLISLYKSLIKSNDIDILIDYINKYHINDIQHYLHLRSNVKKETNNEFRSPRQYAKEDEELDKLIKPKRLYFAAHVYGHIIQNELFVKEAANKYPELFAKVFYGMETEQTANIDVVTLYIDILFQKRNQAFINELKTINASNAAIKDLSDSNDLHILPGLLVHTKAAAANHVWYPIGEGGVKLLKYDKDHKVFLRSQYNSDHEQELWNYNIYVAIVYINYMVRESIYKDGGWHMWLFYYQHFVEGLIDQIVPSHLYDEPEYNSEYPTFAHYLIDYIISIVIDWLQLAKKLETENRVIDTIRCLGNCIFLLCEADSDQIYPGFRARQVGRIISRYLDYSFYPNNPGAKMGRIWLQKLFLHPNGVDFGTPVITKKYLATVKKAWKDFDKIPFEYNGNDKVIADFESDVLKRLNIVV